MGLTWDLQRTYIGPAFDENYRTQRRGDAEVYFEHGKHRTNEIFVFSRVSCSENRTTDFRDCRDFNHKRKR